ncbi:MAG: Mur ligase family protein, partial [bacterium]|nr:Mur ligase family protein [bacterium]
DNNSELAQAHKLGVATMSYPEMLGLISKTHYTIAVSGTHGKTTTTGMLAKVFIDAKKDPTVIIGSFLKDFASNFVAGFSDYFIVEACEYKRSFLNIWPTIVVITNIDRDHLDYYKDLPDIQSAFREFVLKIPEGGFLICDTGDESLKPIIKDLKCRVINFTEYLKPENLPHKIELQLPGEHNRRNASVALAVADVLRLNQEETFKSLASFAGTWRRFEYKGETKNGIIVYDDYAHHPTEIKATLQGFREKFPDKEITIIFQPHLYSRTKLLLNDFAEALKSANKVILAPIYAAREQFDETISSNMLAEKIKELGGNVLAFPNPSAIADYLKTNLSPNSVLITMGAGDVYKVGDLLLS